MTYRIASFIIDKSRLPAKTICSAPEEMCSLRKGQTIEINFEEDNYKGDYEIIKVEEKWEINDNGDDTYWYDYTVRAVSGTFTKL
jgi:hypothetical protein